MAVVRLLARIGAQGERVLRLRPGESLLELVNRAGLPLGQSCHGEGICRSCDLEVVAGAHHLTPLAPLELRARGLDRAGGWRLACQVRAVAAANDDSAAQAAAATVTLWHPAWGHPEPVSERAAAGSRAPDEAPQTAADSPNSPGKC
ncbi:MAG: 2Fe-2S iron-sulfur cluster binding domain-containing protein [Myxococcales bacterium]|nr:2Fe-2S iron-sulfur cluster binding domain-containing protein [Myxococcales bacterium]